MQKPTHSLPSLFKQLGLPSSPEDIEKFVTTHSPLKPDLKLEDAFSGRRPKRLFCAKSILKTLTGLKSSTS